MTSSWGSCDKSINALLKEVVKQGGEVVKEKNHIKVKGGNGRGPVSVNCSKVNPRIILDVRGDLRRAGYVL